MTPTEVSSYSIWSLAITRENCLLKFQNLIRSCLYKLSNNGISMNRSNIFALSCAIKHAEKNFSESVASE